MRREDILHPAAHNEACSLQRSENLQRMGTQVCPECIERIGAAPKTGLQSAMEAQRKWAME